MYRSAPVKIVVMPGYVFRVSNHLRKAYTDAVHMPRLLSWVHWYRCCIISGAITKHGQRLVDVCPRLFKIIMLDWVLLIRLVMKCDIWNLVLPHSRSNGERSLTSQSATWVSFLSIQYWRSQWLEISYTIDWLILEWTGTPRTDKLGSPYGYKNPTASEVLGDSDIRNDAMVYYANESSRTLRDAKYLKVEANLWLLWFA